MFIGLASISLILTIVEIVLFALHKLQPKRMVIMNTLKSAIWIGMFIHDIVAVASSDRGERGVGTISLVVAGGLLYVISTALSLQNIILINSLDWHSLVP